MPLTALDPTAALVVIDLQEGLRQASTAPATTAEVIERTARLARAFRAHGLPVVLVRVTDGGASFSPGRTDRGRASGAARPAGWDTIVPELSDLGDVVVSKRNPGAFVGTDLDLVLRRHGVTQVVLTGISTSMGVEGTARQGHDLGYDVVVVTDAVGDRDPADHEHAVRRVLPRVAETTTVAELLAAAEALPEA